MWAVDGGSRREMESWAKYMHNSYHVRRCICCVKQFVCCYSSNVSKSWLRRLSRAVGSSVWNDKSFDCLLWIAMFHKRITLTIRRNGDFHFSYVTIIFSTPASSGQYWFFTSCCLSLLLPVLSEIIKQQMTKYYKRSGDEVGIKGFFLLKK